MAQQNINIGSAPNDGTGDYLRDAFEKAENNFTDLYTTKAPLASPTLTGTPTAPTATPGTNTTQIATTAFVMGAVTGLFDLKGSTDASSNPNYPAASKGDAYVITVAGKIGGASGTNVDIGDVYIASADNAGGTQASVGTSWFIIEHNLQGTLLSANNLSDVSNQSTARTNLGLAIGSNVQAYSAVLAAYAAGASPTAAFLALADDADNTAMRTTLGLAIGTNVQAYGANIAPPIPTGRWMLGEGTEIVTASAAPGQDSLRIYPVRIRRSITVTDLKAYVATAAASGNVQIAIYAASATTLAPTGAPLYSSGSLSTASTGEIGVTGQSIALTAGVYWFASLCDASANTAAFRSRSTASASVAELAGGATATLVLTNSVPTGFAKSHTFGTWPTLTGSFSGDSLSETTGAMPVFAFLT